MSLWQLKCIITFVIIVIIILTEKKNIDLKQVSHLFQRTKNTAATVPTINKQNGDTMDTTSTVRRFPTLCALFLGELPLLVTDSLDTDAVSVVRDGLEVPCVGVSVVKLFGLFVV